MSVMNLVRVEEIRPDGKVRFATLYPKDGKWHAYAPSPTPSLDGYGFLDTGITPNPIEETDIRVGKTYPCVSCGDTNVILALLKPGFA